jgi:hypothetical protein
MGVMWCNMSGLQTNSASRLADPRLGAIVDQVVASVFPFHLYHATCFWHARIRVRKYI